jgi:hypothetical protein
MNRVRKIGDEYQVLLTPHQRFHSGIELMLGNWTDPHLENYYVETYKSWEDAMARAYNFPDINWDQLILYHKDIYSKLFEIIRYEIDVNNFDMTLKPILLNSHQVKNLMFDRVADFGKRFRLIYHMNDIISFRISNPYTANLKDLAEILSVNQALRIMYTSNDNGVIRLVGKTDLGTSYEIILAPSLVDNWEKWATKNYHLPEDDKMKKLRDVLKQQKEIDKKLGSSLR